MSSNSAIISIRHLRLCSSKFLCSYSALVQQKRNLYAIAYTYTIDGPSYSL